MKTDTLTKNKKSSNPYSINSEKGQIGLYLKKNDSTAKPGKKTKIFKVEQISHYPSPFDQKTTIVYKLDHPSCVSLVVYSSSSSGMTYLACGHKREGYHKVDFDASLCHDVAEPLFATD